MTNRHVWRLGLGATIAAATLTIAGAGDAKPGGAQPIYNYTYYNDATHTGVPVGRQNGACYSFGAGVDPHVFGQATPYYETEQVGWCQGGIAT